jgi:hypothetical protein
MPSHAHFVITENPASLQGGITYEWLAATTHGGDGSFSGLVGAKSWAEPGNPVDAKGWTHTTDWVAIDFSAVHEPSLLTIQVDRGASGSLFPAFTLYQGWETVNSDASNHTFNNIGPISWATNLSYIDHVANAGGPLGTANGTGLTSVSKEFVLVPGLYSLVIGGNPPFELGQTGQHEFTVTLNLSAVPVPAAFWLFGSSLAAMAGLARRKLTA